MCLGDVIREPTRDLVGLPIGFLTRVGPLVLFPDDALRFVYTDAFLLGFKAVVSGALVLCVLGARPYRPVAIGTCLLLIVHHALVRSVGHVNHGELTMLYGAFVLTFSPAADAWALGGRPAKARPLSHYTAPMVLMTWVFCLSYAFVGAHRIAMSGPSIFLDGSIVRLVVHAGTRPGLYGAAYGVEWLARPPAQIALQVGFVGVTLMEVLSPLCLFSTRFRRLWIVTIGSFHLGTFLLMQLLFFHNLVLMPLLMFDWQRCIRMKFGREPR